VGIAHHLHSPKTGGENTHPTQESPAKEAKTSDGKEPGEACQNADQIDKVFGLRLGALRDLPTQLQLESADPMQKPKNINILFIAGFGPIVPEIPASRKLYNQLLGINFKEETGGYLHTEALSGAKTFALWPLAQAAQSCFNKDTWPHEIPTPQAWLEFDVEDVEKATTELESQGHRMLIKNKKEPWGQTVSRFLSPEGLLIGITLTPQLRDKN
jgi:catechol 2,3-dioxygenase-like lactoylglutathione lyase family enzyme